MDTATLETSTESGDHHGGRPGGRPALLTVGTVVWLASELMFFSGLFAAYFTVRGLSEGPWPPEGVELKPAIAGVFTLFLVASSGTMQFAVQTIREGDRHKFRFWLVTTLLLAAVFLGNQLREYAGLSFQVDSNAYGSAFYLMTGFHGLHVLGGMVAMVVLLGRSVNAGFGAAETPAVEVVSYYWHFVDVVWVGLFATLYLLK
ncbi:MAG TPA: heme-copper oxidase subunit III [Acidimicrobiales bacterium]|nr:heme-copper oxidase subunit III [Acidimicrobiales bacterium]